jgi:hypothetical protein
MMNRVHDGSLMSGEAIEYVVENLALMHEAINGDRPSRPDEPAHFTLVRWAPILADYQMFVARADTATARMKVAETKAEDLMADATHRVWLAQTNAAKAISTLKRLENELRASLAIIEESKS